jgi:hypothetical protein
MVEAVHVRSPAEAANPGIVDRAEVSEGSFGLGIGLAVDGETMCALMVRENFLIGLR